MVPHILACKQIQQQLNETKSHDFPSPSIPPLNEAPIVQLWSWKSLAIDPPAPAENVSRSVFPTFRWQE